MCETCGCNLTSGQKNETQSLLSVTVMKNLLDENNHQAQHNREHFERHQVLAVNLMSAPGSGKTGLLERLAEKYGDQLNMAVIEGDLETDNDARRLREKGVTSIQINTKTACHLDAAMIHDALHDLDLDALDLLFIENVGNLVCPASFDLGQHLNISLLSTPEGDDKPEKYPLLFRVSDLVLISKTDLLPYLSNFSLDNVFESLRRTGFNKAIMQTGIGDDAGLDSFYNYLTRMYQQRVVEKSTADVE